MKKIGIIGAGIMASGIVQNFLKQGYEVHVWNRGSDHLAPLLEAGAIECENPKIVTEKSDIVIECVSDDEASRSVWFGPKGILAGASPRHVLITSATLSTKYIDELVTVTESLKLTFLDMPLTGSRAGAESGNLQLLMGGDKGVIESIKPELEAISRKIYYFGKTGNGMRFKLVLNSLIAIHAVAASQAAMLAIAAGLDLEVVTDAIMDGMGPSSPVTGLMFVSLKNPEKQVRFAVAMIEKDLRYAKQMKNDLGVEFDLLNDAQKNFANAKGLGLGDEDWSKIAELYKLPETGK